MWWSTAWAATCWDGPWRRWHSSGRLVSYSSRSGTVDASALLGEMRSVTGFAVGRLVRERPELLGRLRAELWSAATEGRLRAAVHAEYPLEQVAEAYAEVASRRNLGRVAVRLATQ
jgi:NADPH2:quinone reductase